LKVAITLLCLGTLIVSGCAVFQESEISQEEKVQIVFDTARAGTFAAMQRLGGAEERAEELIELIDETILPLLASDQSIGKDTSDLILSLLPSDYEIYLSPAFTTFHAYYETPDLNEILSDDNIELIRSLFNGIRSGAEEFVG